MSDQENFLARWSRRKLEPADENVKADKPDVGKPAAGENVAKPVDEAPARQVDTAPVPEFDLASLPPIESIGADTDISAFLKPGVPSELRHAALRRVWVTDPAIRDFKGLQENDWNFNDPNGILGFGELGPEHDVAKMVAKLFGDKPASEPLESAAASEQPAVPSHESNVATGLAAREESATDELRQLGSAAVEKSSLQRDENVASQHGDAQPDAEPTKARRHGGAMPQ